MNAINWSEVHIDQSKLMYCDCCANLYGVPETVFYLTTKKENIKVCGENIIVQAPIWVCTVCKSTQPCVEGNVDSIQMAVREYRRKHSLDFHKPDNLLVELEHAGQCVLRAVLPFSVS